MYDITKRKGFIEPTVKTLIEVLKQYPQDAKITICGDSYCFIHCEQDNSCVTLDNEELGDCYPDEDFEEFDFSTMTSGEEIWQKTTPSSKKDEVSEAIDYIQSSIKKVYDDSRRYVDIINSIVCDLSNKSTESANIIVDELINSGCMTEADAKEIINIKND